MAASIGAFILNRAASNIAQTVLFKLFPSSCQPELQLVRNARRSCKPRKWQVPRRRSGSFWNERELTLENREFLKEAVVDQYIDKINISPLKDGPWARNTWTPRTMRTGVLAVKIGVIPQWTTSGEKFHTTLLQVLDNHVVRYVPPEVYSKSISYNTKWLPKQYGSVVVGALSADPSKFTKQYCGLFSESGLPPKRKLTRFLVTPDAAIQPATPLLATHFQVGDYVDVQAKTIGHGFQGVVKRWGFKGGPGSHGTTKWHRRPGNIGGGRGKGKVWKGRKLPGHMGMEWRCLKGLKIWRINTKYNILYVHSQNVPGPTHCYVRVFDTTLPLRRKQMAQRPPVMPTYYADDAKEPLPEELFAPGLFRFTDESIVLQETEKAKKKK